MELNDKQTRLLIAGVIAVVAGVLITMSRTGAPGTDSGGFAPEREQTNPQGLEAIMQGLHGPENMLGITADGGFTDESKFLHFFAPNDSHFVNPDCDYKMYVRHRYPTISGTNISTLIHKGYSPLMVPSKRDYDWLAFPPADQEFAG